MSTAVMDNAVMASVNVTQDIREHGVIFRVSVQRNRWSSISFTGLLLADLCAGVSCNYGTCYEGRCSCTEGYTGYYCDTPSRHQWLESLSARLSHVDVLVVAVPPIGQAAPPTVRTPFNAQTVPMIGLKRGQLIDYGRIVGARAGPVGAILAFVTALLLFPMALAFAARKCTQGACIPGGARAGYVPVMTGASGVTQTENGEI